MGEVKESVKGDGGKRKSADKPIKGGENMLAEVRRLRDETSELAAKKDEDADSEGDDVKMENVRKAATLRAVHSLFSAAEQLLAGY